MASIDGGNIDPNGSAYNDILQQILTQGAGAGWNSQKANTTLGQYGTDFAQQFQNATGQAPTADQINQFYQQAVSPIINTSAGFSNTDPNAVVQQYVPQAFQTQIQQNQQQNVIPQEEQQLSSLASTVGAQTAQQLSNPNSSAYSGFSGALNNLGITPGSGAFQEGVGGTVGNAATGALQSLLTGTGSNITGNASPNLASLSGTGQTAENSLSSNNNNLYDFNLQSQLGQMLAQMSQPSSAQKDIGMASGASNALSNVMGSNAQGASGLMATSYVCIELIKRGLICESDMDDFHVHIMPALFKKGRAFWKYAVDGKKLVDAANAKGLDFSIYKKWLFDDVMAESDPYKAVDEYARACEAIAMRCDPSLWDERVMRSSFLDSLPFLPALLSYKPFQKALWKCLRIKMLFLYDKPRCEVHYGSR